MPGLPRQTVYVSDAVTTAGRLADLASRGLATAGVAVWGLGGEDPVSWDALREARPAACKWREAATAPSQAAQTR